MLRLMTGRTLRRVDLQVFVNHKIGISDFPIDEVYATNGSRD
jgi:hypothetical protein